MKNILKIFTQNVSMNSPTYRSIFTKEDVQVRSLGEREADDTEVNMTADVVLSEYWDENDKRTLQIDVINRMWVDPQDEIEGVKLLDKEYFSLRVGLTKKEVIYLKKYIESFLDTMNEE